MDVRELRPGLWRWTARHAEWEEREVSSAYLETDDAVCLVDPLVPSGEEERFFRALDRDVERLARPVTVVLTNPWHRRSSGELAGRYAGTVRVAPDLPDGFEALPGGMQPEDFVVFVPAQRVLFTGDTLVDGEPCPEDWLADGREHQLACLRRLLELDAELVVPSHGEPLTLAQLGLVLG